MTALGGPRGVSGRVHPGDERTGTRPSGGPGGPRVVLVGTYPPTHCGIATFTDNLRHAIAGPQTHWQADVLRVLDRDEPEQAPEVVGHWVAGDRGSLRQAVRTAAAADAVILQHEYGVFGGEDGDEVLDFVRGVSVPLVAVLHTALTSPSPHQREVLDRVIDAASAVVVQSEAARRRIEAVHPAAEGRVVVIPHGAAANFDGPVRTDLPRPTVLTWGLLSPGKGIEHGIDALGRLHATTPAIDVTYRVTGQTHPKVRAAAGEEYRATLQARARARGVEHRVVFDDGYYDWESLRRLVRSVDAVLLPYDSREQVSSGVLVEAVASAKPVIATRFPHAEELLSGGRGLLVDHADADAMADAINRLLHEPGLAERLSAATRSGAQSLLWPAVGRAYRSLIDAAVKAQAVA